MVNAHPLSCENCGDALPELRLVRGHGWQPDQIVCEACFARVDGENSFTDHPMAQEAER